MNTRFRILGALACAAFISPPVQAVDQCEMSLATKALSVQADSGNGNYDCTALQSPDGLPLQDLTLTWPSLVTIDPVAATLTTNDTIAWSVATFQQAGT